MAGLSGLKTKLPWKKASAPAEADNQPGLDVEPSTEGKPLTWWTPWTWTDTSGVYFGDDGAWLYRQLPLSVLDGHNIESLLRTGETVLKDRDIHLLLHAWSAPVESGMFADTNTNLDTYLHDTIRVNVPVRRLLIGVQLVATAKTQSFMENLYETVDHAIGEYVPDYGLYDNDKATVQAWLDQFDATPLDAVAAAQLESWYLLGQDSNVAAEEEDTYIRLPQHAMVMAATANPDPASSRFPAAPPVPPGARSAVVASARGYLGQTSRGVPALKNPSFVLARRATAAPGWVDQLRQIMPAANAAGLPLRQLPALDETLPSSGARNNPMDTPADAGVFSQAGFINPSPVGDRAGVLLGMGGIGYTDPIRINPLRDPQQPLWIVGGEIAGKTFLAEHLAYQSVLAGFTVRYLSGDGDAGRIFVTDSTPGFTTATGAMLDPGPLPEAFANWRSAALAGLASATPQIEPDVFSKAASRTAVHGVSGDLIPSLQDTMRLIVEPRTVAQLRRAANEPGTLAWAMLHAGQSPPAGTCAWSVPHLLQGFIEEYGTRAAATELLICAALLRPAPPDSAGVLVVVDGYQPGPAVAEALRAAARTGMRVGMIVTSRTVPTTPRQGVSVIGFDVDNHALTAWAGPRVNDQDISGQRRFAVIDDNNTVVSAATMTVIDQHHRISPLVVAPVNDELLPALTRTPGTRYR